MRLKIAFMTALVAVAMLIVGLVEAQPPGQAGQPPGKGPPGKGDKGPPGKGDKGDKGKKGKGKGQREVPLEEVAAHIMAFDKSNSGTLSRDDLPERMQWLFDRGDTNQDGMLDKEEIMSLAAKMATEPTPFDKGKGKGKGKGPGGKGPPGKGKGFFDKGG